MPIRVPIEESDLLRACRDGDVEALQEFVREHRRMEDYNIMDDTDGELGPLSHAVLSNSPDCVRILLSTQLVHIPSDSVQWIQEQSDCLDWATNNDSFDIVKLLLENDRDFVLWSKLKANSCMFSHITEEMLHFQIEVLNGMNFPFCYEFMKWVLRNFHCINDVEAVGLIRIFERVVALVVDENSNDFLQRIYASFEVSTSSADIIEPLLKWCIEKWHCAETNSHCDLVRTLVNDPHTHFNARIFFLLHSTINNLKSDAVREIFRWLLQMDKTKDRDVVEKVTSVLWPKVVEKASISDHFYDIMVDVGCNELKLLLAWLYLTGVIEHIKIDAEIIGFDLLIAFMPFSTEVTLDDYLTTRKEKLKRFVDRIQRRNELWVDAIERASLTELRKFDDAEVMAEYCVKGAYQAKSTLKSLCRATLRGLLLQHSSDGSKKTHKQLVADIRSLELPITLEKFMLFNLSDY